MFYERKVRYLDYLEHGERIKGSGFVKQELRDKTLRIEIAVKAHRDAAGVFPVLLSGNGKEAPLGELTLQEGCGEFRHTCQVVDGIGETGIFYEELRGIRIPLGEGREIVCGWEAAPKETEKTGGKPPEVRKRSGEEMQPTEEGQPKPAEAEKKDVKIKKAEAEKKNVKMELAEAEKKDVEIEKTETEKKSVKIEQTEKTGGRNEKEEEPEADKMIRLQEDKWAQLCTIYPHIRPFRDEREYLSISPADFVLFPAADYRAAHNSFLLHGYYNYHHLILARMERKGEILYYLGVPGNYFEKEKQVAVMFGFESFECADEPADYGDFGYYMMRTNI